MTANSVKDWVWESHNTRFGSSHCSATRSLLVHRDTSLALGLISRLFAFGVKWLLLATALSNWVILLDWL